MHQAYPLNWPIGYKRPPRHQRNKSRFSQTIDKAQRFLRDEVGRLGGHFLVVSTNLRLRQDGLIYVDDLKKKIDDPGVAVYFRYLGKDITMCCDNYVSVWENIYALGKSIKAIRSMERWGVSEFLERSFTGFTALPENNKQSTCWEILGFERATKDKGLIRDSYILLAKQRHPDVGGSTVTFQELQEAYHEENRYADEK